MSKNNSLQIPDPNVVFPNEYKTSCFIKNVITAPNISVGDYTYYDDAVDPTGFEKNNVLFNYPVFGTSSLLASSASWHQAQSSLWGQPITGCVVRPLINTPPHLDQLPHKGDIVVGNDVWIGRESIIMPGVKIGDGAIIAAYSVVVKDVPAYTVYGGNPAKFIKDRFDAELKDLLLRFRWWDLEPEQLVEMLPLLCSPDLDLLKQTLRSKLSSR